MQLGISQELVTIIPLFYAESARMHVLAHNNNGIIISFHSTILIKKIIVSLYNYNMSEYNVKNEVGSRNYTEPRRPMRQIIN